MKNPVQKLTIVNPRTKRANAVRAWNVDFGATLAIDAEAVLCAIFASIKCGSSSPIAVKRMRRVIWEQFKADYEVSNMAYSANRYRVAINKEHEAFLLTATDPAHVVRSLEAARV